MLRGILMNSHMSDEERENGAILLGGRIMKRDCRETLAKER